MHEWLGFALELLGILFSWPVVVLALVFIFRRKIEQMLGKLSERISSFSVGGLKAEFRTDDNISVALLELAFARSQNRLVTDSEQGSDDDDDTEEVDDSIAITEAGDDSDLIDEITLNEFDQELERLSNGG